MQRFRFISATLLLALATACSPAQESYSERLASHAASQSTIPDDARMDVNQASLEQLMCIKGLTAVWAKRIIRYRPYRTKLDLLDRGIIPEAVYLQIRDSLVAHQKPR